MLIDSAQLDACQSRTEARVEDLTAALRVVTRMRRLALRDRQVLIWTVVGLTQTEIATRLGIARSAVGRDVARAKARLLDSLRR